MTRHGGRHTRTKDSRYPHLDYPLPGPGGEQAIVTDTVGAVRRLP